LSYIGCMDGKRKKNNGPLIDTACVIKDDRDAYKCKLNGLQVTRHRQGKEVT
jgi:hypothetical protein